MGELVSIIMPSFNTASFIGASIESVLNQTYPDWELIIVDDCSTDNSAEIVKSYRDKRIILMQNEVNSGAAVSRNKAIKAANGRWIAFLDSDDLWEPSKLEKQIAFMKENNCYFSCTEYERIDEHSKPLHVYVTAPKIITKRKMYRYCYPGCLTVMYDKNKIGLIQINDIKKNNDYAMWLKICNFADCLLLQENLAKYRIRQKSISHDKFSKIIKSHYELFRFCDGRNALVSFLFACRNIFYGFLKKQKYEKVC